MLKQILNKIYFSENDLLSLNKGIIIYINPFSYLKLRKNRIDLSSFDIITSDGIVIKSLFNLFFKLNNERLSPDFSSYFTPLFKQIEEKEESIYFIGTEQYLLEKAIKNIKTKFPKLNIVGFRNGFFSSKEEIENHINEINKINPEVLIVGMGTPTQEKYLIHLKKSGWQGISFSCGGFLHQTAFQTEYYPNWVNKFNLRWLYRIYREPKLIKRYTIDYSWFLIVFFWDFLKYKFSKD